MLYNKKFILTNNTTNNTKKYSDTEISDHILTSEDEVSSANETLNLSDLDETTTQVIIFMII